MTRPQSTVWFERAYVASALASLGNSILGFNQTRFMVSQSSTELGDLGNGFVYATIVLRLCLSLILTFYVARRASNIAKWIVILLFVGWLLGLPAAWGILKAGNFRVLPWVIAFLLYVFAIICLLRKDARDWFARKGRTAKDDAIAFE